MFGKIVSSDGEIILAPEEISKEIILENQLQYFEINTDRPFYISLNGDTDKILIRYDNYFKLERFPVNKFIIEKYFNDMDLNFSYYGFY